MDIIIEEEDVMVRWYYDIFVCDYVCESIRDDGDDDGSKIVWESHSHTHARFAHRKSWVDNDDDDDDDQGTWMNGRYVLIKGSGLFVSFFFRSQVQVQPAESLRECLCV